MNFGHGSLLYSLSGDFIISTWWQLLTTKSVNAVCSKCHGHKITFFFFVVKPVKNFGRTSEDLTYFCNLSFPLAALEIFQKEG